jgi:hypothetical protein
MMMLVEQGLLDLHQHRRLVVRGAAVLACHWAIDRMSLAAQCKAVSGQLK